MILFGKVLIVYPNGLSREKQDEKKLDRPGKIG